MAMSPHANDLWILSAEAVTKLICASNNVSVYAVETVTVITDDADSDCSNDHNGQNHNVVDVVDEEINTSTVINQHLALQTPKRCVISYQIQL